MNKTFVRCSVGAVVSDFDIRISNFSTFGTPKVELSDIRLLLPADTLNWFKQKFNVVDEFIHTLSLTVYSFFLQLSTSVFTGQSHLIFVVVIGLLGTAECLK